MISTKFEEGSTDAVIIALFLFIFLRFYFAIPKIDLYLHPH